MALAAEFSGGKCFLLLKNDLYVKMDLPVVHGFFRVFGCKVARFSFGVEGVSQRKTSLAFDCITCFDSIDFVFPFQNLGKSIPPFYVT